MKTILFDLLASQPAMNTKFHGGGEYIKTIFLELCKKIKEENIRIITFYNPDKFIDEWIKEEINKNGVKNYLVNSYEDVLNINELNDVDVFFAGLLDPFRFITLPKNIKVIGVYHGLRVLELPIDRYAPLYANTIKEYLNYSSKVLLKDVFFLKKYKEVKQLLDKCDHLVAVSDHSKYSALSFYPNINEDKISVFYSPMKYIESYDDKSLHVCDKNKIILLLGGNRWTKNIYRAIIATDELFTNGKLNGYKVRIIGNITEKIKKKIRNIDKYEILDYVTPIELEKNYKQCDIFLYPTLNEGFGYPPLEAMRYDKTCIISAITSLTEVYGDGVYYFNPYDINEIKARLLQAVERKIDVDIIRNRVNVISDRQKEDLNKLCQLIIT